MTTLGRVVLAKGDDYVKFVHGGKFTMRFANRAFEKKNWSRMRESVPSMFYKSRRKQSHTQVTGRAVLEEFILDICGD